MVKTYIHCVQKKICVFFDISEENFCIVAKISYVWEILMKLSM